MTIYMPDASEFNFIKLAVVQILGRLKHVLDICDATVCDKTSLTSVMQVVMVAMTLVDGCQNTRPAADKIIRWQDSDTRQKSH